MAEKIVKSKKIKVRSGKLPVGILILVIISVALIVYSFLAPIIYPTDLAATNLRERLLKPSIFGLSDSGHLLGTDNVGRDTAVRLLYAIRSSIMLASVGLLTSMAFGVFLGILAGVCG